MPTIPGRRLASELLDEAVATAQQMSLILWPHGGQQGARRNAHRAVLDDSAAAMLRADVSAAVQRNVAHTHRERSVAVLSR